ncbi:cytochrome c [Fulvivirgaceae bacterium BMA10]|uniref:Cytochrome c n=1 Tax=Splendidivirga corallicola TaxID=3051826 RepID=A0ABT8KVN0_9BACT|nr:cytochrome c [Fulvivirgaceae bacterium BMA10]
MRRLVFLSFAVSIFTACGTASSSKNEKEDEKLSVVEVSEARINAGKEVYQTYCFACHMQDGGGVPNLNPPLIKSPWVNGDKETLIKIVLNGSAGGQYEVDGELFYSAMTPHNFLSDQQIADVLTFVRNNFENKASAVTAEEVLKIRNALKQE